MTSLPDDVLACLAAHPDIELIDCMMPDICGLLRGKQLPISSLEKIYKTGMPLPTSTALMDSKGQLVDTIVEGPQDGDPDRLCHPVPGTFSFVPWAPRPTAQVLMSQHNKDGSIFIADPRAVLTKVLSRFEEVGLTPVVALELEFYLTEPDLPLRPAKTPNGWTAMTGAQATGFEDLYDFAPFMEAVYAACRAQNIPAEGLLSEYGPGQFEVNLTHVNNVITSCDHATLLKRVVKGVARRQGMVATFMAKPYSDCEGSGLHAHMSLVDRDGNNIFAGNLAGGWSPAFESAIAGMQATMAESMAIFAPNANSYRRFKPGSYVPLTPTWGPNHRAVSLRIPVCDAANMRFEHRVSGADANPYLMMAAVLAGVHHGLVNELTPGRMTPEGTVMGPQKATLPSRWYQALDVFEDGRVLKDYFGAQYHDYYLRCRRFEEGAVHSEVTERDLDWYWRAH
ncbi:MAG: glutamine synthetase [Alphaproteobacteria bacterium]|nr:MAG: glutamine synthetase [Alphaproteobacteria bacterium]